VTPFALTRLGISGPWIDPGPPPYIGGVGDEQYRKDVIEVIRYSSQLTPDDGITIDISPASLGNNTLGTNDGHGRPINPATGSPYTPEIVKRGDFGRVLAEFWADGPNSETPPGHWNVLANAVADNPSFSKRIGGTGPALDDLEWDIKVYFALNASVHDAACAAWTVKRVYDGWRPISAIRMMGQRGQAEDPDADFYHPNGFMTVPGLIEIVTEESSKRGGKHEGLLPGFPAIYAWSGPLPQPDPFQPPPTNTYAGVHWINPTTWMPYQKRSFVTPSFPGYISGHSTFSRAAAEVLAGITGSPFFPGGLAIYTVEAGTGLDFEEGPTTPVQLQWATYFDAADQAGLSRLWGGIHVSSDDLAGRKAGAECGKRALALAQRYFNGL
jgi:hypothetical protein